MAALHCTDENEANFHSNADEEWVFSLIRQKKTDFRSALSLDGTLASILAVKMASEDAYNKYTSHLERY